jgi:aminoglycoside phosphotransferase (APT) family kinase protein
MVQRTDPEEKRVKLELWLKERLSSAECIAVTSMEKAPGGYGSEIHFLDVSWLQDGQEKAERLVIREEPKVFRVFPEYDMAREFTTMKALEATDIPAPKMYWLETDEGVLGAPFYIMGRVDGEILDPQQFGDESRGPLYEASPEGRRGICTQALEVMAKINRVDCGGLGISYTGAPKSGADALEKQLKFYSEMAEWAGVEPHSLVDGAFDWFRNNRSEPGQVALCWGDARLGNLMYRDGEIMAVLDWDMSHIGVAETDLAWFLAVDWLVSESGLRGSRWEGMPAKEDIIPIYENALGRKLQDFSYHEAFAFLKLGIIFWRVVKSMPGIPPEYIPENPALSRLANLLHLEDSI